MNRFSISAMSGTVIAMSVVVAVALHHHTRVTGHEIINAWLQAEAVSLQEGNILSAITKHQRILQSSNFIRGGRLCNIEQPAGAPLFDFGDTRGLDGCDARGRPGVLASEPAGIFEHSLSLRFPSRPNVAAYFKVRPKYAWPAWSLFAGASALIVIACGIAIAANHRREVAQRLGIIRKALAELPSSSTPSELLTEEFPEIIGAWDDLREQVETAHAELRKAAMSVAIARTTQMVAHDVRKPFSMVKMGLSMLLQASGDPARMEAVARRLQDHVGRALAHANAMLADILEASSAPSKPHTEAVSIKNLITAALDQVFQHQESSSIQLVYNFGHVHMADVDQARGVRVLVNILDNARQAMRDQGLIAIRTVEDASEDPPAARMIAVKITNSGTFIAPQDRERLFDPFFTKGKAGGTGLGLVIARRVVEAHGGTIRCESSIDDGTSFILTLPVAGVVDPDRGSSGLHSTSTAIRRTFRESLQIGSHS